MGDLRQPVDQTSEVLYYLLTRGEINRRDILLECGILNLTARIAGLRNTYALDVVCDKIQTTNKFGRKVDFGVWSLSEEDSERAVNVYNDYLDSRKNAPKLDGSVMFTDTFARFDLVEEPLLCYVMGNKDEIVRYLEKPDKNYDVFEAIMARCQKAADRHMTLFLRPAVKATLDDIFGDYTLETFVPKMKDIKKRIGL